MKIASIILFFLFSFFSAQSYAQSKTDTGSVKVNADPRVKEIDQKYTDSRNGKIKGYRVQIHFSAEKSKAKDAKSKFLNKFPDVHAYEIFETPYFKIRVGDFRTKLEAYKFMKEIQEIFPMTFIVADEIELPPL